MNRESSSNLEDGKEKSIDFGDPELNRIFQSIEPKFQKEIMETSNTENQIKLLKMIGNEELQQCYEKLPESYKKKVDETANITSRTSLLKFLCKQLDKILKQEKERLEKERLEKERLEKERLEKERLEKERLEKEREEKELEEGEIPEETVTQFKPSQFTALKNPQLIDYMLSDESEDEDTEVPQPPKTELAKAFDRLVDMFYTMNKTFHKYIHYELEVRFGTKGPKPLTKNDYDNVIKVLKSFGFETTNPTGLSSLRAKCEFLDSKTGKFKMSNVRVEINGLTAIEKYCRSNDIKTVYKEEPNSVLFIQKKPFISTEGAPVYPLNFNDFNFRVSLQTEEKLKKNFESAIIDNWRSSKKEFRYLNRVTFKHPSYPVIVDISITKSGNKSKDRRGFNQIIPVYTLEESQVFSNMETYEIELELDTDRIGPGKEFQSPDKITDALRKVIKYVLGGLQGTMYPISNTEQTQVLQDYMKMIWENEYEPSKKISSQYFIGPNSITLQLSNLGQADENINVPTIKQNFVVTEKADGDRHLLYISNIGKMYLIDTNMNVKFTGAKVVAVEAFDTLLDGELISYNRQGEFINLYAAFDVYYYLKEDVRRLPFLASSSDAKHKKTESRYALLDKLKEWIKPVSIMDMQQKQISPIKFEVKKFYPISPAQSIFDGCKTILEKEQQGLFEYETDGLIFTHSYYGVGSNTIGKAGPKTKTTWEYSFKWKPPQYNTIDFLVTTTKGPNGEDVVRSLFEDGQSMSSYMQYSEYKVIELRCGFNERTDGFINPCQDIIDDNLPEYKPRLEDKGGNDYLPKRFYPTDPYDPNAGLCNLMLKLDGSGTKQMFTKNGEVITDNTIVEFAYNIDAPEGWRWEPLRVRYDKTSKLLRGEREYGNSYRVCNENWKSIHPSGRITEQMLMTGENIPDIYVSEDVYYNTPSGNTKTESMRNFHNLYVKKMLISSVCKRGDSLIDYACGKAGDLPKWIAAKLDFVFGIDYSADNLENRLDGACARYLKSKKMNKVVPSALFVHGNSAFNIKNGSAMLNDKAKQITNAVFGIGPKTADKIGKGVAKLYGKGDSGFHVSSCQFALHYFFENPDTLKGFLRNVAECTKINGYFIGTSYDGKLIFNELKKIKMGESIQINDGTKKIWEIVKGYASDVFEDNSSSIGYNIDVYQESINQYISEFLVNYTYLDRVLEAYGFKLITREEANEIGLPDGTGLFSELFLYMIDDIKKNKFKQSLYGDAPAMTSHEKKISFLNRFFVYKKIREVNIDKIQLDLGEYNEALSEREKLDKEPPLQVATPSIQAIKRRVKKLNHKLELLPATEALSEPIEEPAPVEKIQDAIALEEAKLLPIKKTRKTRAAKDKDTVPKKKAVKQTKKLIIREDDDAL